MSSDSAPDSRLVYGDIIDLPHHVSDRHPPMSLHDRAAQFAPFAALTGYDEMVDEEARLTDRQIEPGEEDLAQLDRKLRLLAARLSAGEHPRVSALVFVPDERKTGGRYKTFTGALRKLDVAGRKMILSGPGTPPEETVLKLDRILDLSADGPDGPDSD